MPRRYFLPALALTVLAGLPALAQTALEDPQAVVLATKAVSALNGTTSVTDVAVQATANYIAGSGCARNCVRECLVEFNIQNCDHLPSAKDRFVCREITGHAVCVPTCTVVGGFLDKGITIHINYPIYYQTTVVVPFSCRL